MQIKYGYQFAKPEMLIKITSTPITIIQTIFSFFRFALISFFIVSLCAGMIGLFVFAPEDQKRSMIESFAIGFIMGVK